MIIQSILRQPPDDFVSVGKLFEQIRTRSIEPNQIGLIYKRRRLPPTALNLQVGFNCYALLFASFCRLKWNCPVTETERNFDNCYNLQATEMRPIAAPCCLFKRGLDF